MMVLCCEVWLLSSPQFQLAVSVVAPDKIVLSCTASYCVCYIGIYLKDCGNNKDD